MVECADQDLGAAGFAVIMSAPVRQLSLHNAQRLIHVLAVQIDDWQAACLSCTNDEQCKVQGLIFITALLTHPSLHAISGRYAKGATAVAPGPEAPYERQVQTCVIRLVRWTSGGGIALVEDVLGGGLVGLEHLGGVPAPIGAQLLGQRLVAL